MLSFGSFGNAGCAATPPTPLTSLQSWWAIWASALFGASRLRVTTCSLECDYLTAELKAFVVEGGTCFASTCGTTWT